MHFNVPGGAVAQVQIIDTLASISCLPTGRLMTPPMDGFDYMPTFPSLSFLVEGSTGQKALFDLGISKNWDQNAPVIADRLATNGYQIQSTMNVADILLEHGVDLSSIGSIVWSHWHWDHQGDPSTFPPSTELVVGPGFTDELLPAWPAGADSPVRQKDLDGRKLVELSFNATCGGFKIGRFDAVDFFGDGSFFILDTPGHAVGHLAGLARTSSNPDTFIFMGGDLCHHGGEMRPSPWLPFPEHIDYPVGSPLLYPCPGEVKSELLTRRNRTCGQAFFDPARGVPVDEAVETVRKAQEADADENVLFVYAHDKSVVEVGNMFPLKANDWKADGWRDKMLWAFLRDFKPVLDHNNASTAMCPEVVEPGS